MFAEVVVHLSWISVAAATIGPRALCYLECELCVPLGSEMASSGLHTGLAGKPKFEGALT